jgi:hypothetical protein
MLPAVRRSLDSRFILPQKYLIQRWYDVAVVIFVNKKSHSSMERLKAVRKGKAFPNSKKSHSEDKEKIVKQKGKKLFQNQKRGSYLACMESLCLALLYFLIFPVVRATWFRGDES